MLNTILVAVDDSPTAKFVIKALGQLRLQPTTNVIFSHIVPTVESDFDLVADRPRPGADEFPYGHLEKQLRAYQDQFDCQTEIEIVAGDPAEEIIRLANIYKADLIIIGNRGLTGVKRILERSVSSQVVSEANCSVLVVKEI
ncbi:universal stress protein [Planktothrix paucivesiculata]|uniref:universal stress protein n=1 Tax=Planktothrix paucivesiculata TaxID=1678308 RepID=UPI0009FA95F5|nr:universal stress protein [Planktothrix paucivesiculata]